MGPKPALPSSGDLYRSRLDQILDHHHELFRLAGLIDWDRFDQEFGRFYRPLGRPAKPTRLMVGLSFFTYLGDRLGLNGDQPRIPPLAILVARAI